MIESLSAVHDGARCSSATTFNPSSDPLDSAGICESQHAATVDGSYETTVPRLPSRGDENVIRTDIQKSDDLLCTSVDVEGDSATEVKQDTKTEGGSGHQQHNESSCS